MYAVEMANNDSEAALVQRLQDMLQQALTHQQQPHRHGAFLAGVLFTGLVGWFCWWRYRYSLWRLADRYRKSQAVQAISKMGPEELQRLLGDMMLPRWALQPDYERVGWLNAVVQQMWPYIARLVSAWAEENVDNLLAANKPAWMRSITLHRFSLGDVCPTVTGVKVFDSDDTHSDEVIMELDFTWAGSQDISFVIKPVPVNQAALAKVLHADQLLDLVGNIVIIKAGMQRLTMNGRLRVTVRPLMAILPLVGSIQLALTEVPRFSFDLTAFGGDISVLPGLEAWLHGLISDSVLMPYCLPEKYVIPLISSDSLAGDRPRGLLDITVVEATHVPRLDVLSASDVYCKLFVRDKRKLKTQVRNNTTRPHWDERFQLLVHFPEAQQLTCVLYDFDPITSDDEIGRVEVKIRDLEPGKLVDDWYDVHPPNENDGDYGVSGNPLSLITRGGQKVVGFFIKPWDVLNHKPFSKLLPGGKEEHKRHCRLRLKLAYHPLDPGEVEAAFEAQTRGMPAEQLSPEIQRVMKGGVLNVRVTQVESLTEKAWWRGGWKRTVKVVVKFAGEEKSTPPVKGRKDIYHLDSELEFVVDGDKAAAADYVELEVWDTHWRDEFKGRVKVPVDQIRDRRLVKGTYGLEGVPRGRIALELHWLAAFAAG